MTRITFRNELIRRSLSLSLSTSLFCCSRISLHPWPPYVIIRVFARNKYQRSPRVSRVSRPGSNFPLWCDIHRIMTLPTVAVAVNGLDIIRDDARPRVSDFRHSKFAPSRRAGVRCPLTLALDTFGKSFRRNIIQRGVKLQPRRPVGRAGRIFQLTTLFRNGYGPMRVACTDMPVRAAFVVPFGFYERVTCRRSDLSLSPSLPFYVDVVGDFFFTSFAARINRRPQRSETRFRYSATVWKTL